ncbi:DUF928 domain-containing protein [Leptolyngbya sp. FACHB-541]|uniref:DUF928 domain-containing protein n=1 Tax=Leptolyngbya sp. FACHB-541 TaxID=2692810 RepID=UPI0016832876|nr:DUF928 domain-containing protein [Leptolyngbya sp. FACHB-541]MBD1999328.1 DUF928 domain-containing protein [Leptolyngbya sp. FACHB-541]
MQTSIKSAVILSLITFFFTSSALAQVEPFSSAPETLGSREDSIHFVPAVNQSAPRSGRSRGGASRGNCPNKPQTLTALVPNAATTNQEASPPDLTVSERPTFWFYVPYALSTERPAEFALLNDAGEYIYQTRVTDMADSGGIVRIRIPDNAPALESSGIYSWTFQVLCEYSNPTDIWGSVERIQLSSELETQLQQLTTPIDQAAFYAANGIWYDALNVLGDLYQTEHPDPAIAAGWASLLQSVGLSAISTEPLLNCCSAP